MIPGDPAPGVAVVADEGPAPACLGDVRVAPVQQVRMKVDHISRIHAHRNPAFLAVVVRHARERVDAVVQVGRVGDLLDVEGARSVDVGGAARLRKDRLIVRPGDLSASGEMDISSGARSDRFSIARNGGRLTTHRQPFSSSAVSNASQVPISVSG